MFLGYAEEVQADLACGLPLRMPGYGVQSVLDYGVVVRDQGFVRRGLVTGGYESPYGGAYETAEGHVGFDAFLFINDSDFDGLP